MRSTNRSVQNGLLGLVLGGLVVVGCGESSTDVPPADLELVALSGDGQVALAGSLLPEAFAVQVKNAGTGRPVEGVSVAWTVVAGDGAVISPPVAASDGAGVSMARLTLGPGLGEYRVQAEFEGMTGSAVTFTASATLTPSLTGISDGPVTAGSPVLLEGQNFLEGSSIVLFSGIQGPVLSATQTRLTVQVPACLPDRGVSVTVRTGSLESNALPLDVRSAGGSQILAPGEAVRLVGASGADCVRLEGEGGAEYLVVVSSASQIAAGQWPYVLTGLTGADEGELPSPPVVADALGVATPAAGGAESPGDGAQWEWDRTVRDLERGLRSRAGPGGAAPAGRQARVPALGERREFSVLNADKDYTDVTAEVMFVSDEAVIYQDLNAPANGLRPADFAELGADFDDPILPTSRDVFGTVGDLDGNDRVVILFTPVVNQLTSRGSDGFVGGFFFGLDLLAGEPNSNEGEVFYAVVPDPGAEFSDARSRQLVMDVVPAILAHELQHMISFHQRILVLGGQVQEALWLSEGMAQMAEDVVGDAFLARGDSAKGINYKSGNWLRAARYLADPGGVSLLIAQGQGTLAERGGGWLFVQYVRGQSGGNAILGDLTRTTRVGVANVTAAAGRSWEGMLPDFSAALYLDGTGLPAEDRILFPDLDLRDVIGVVEDVFPLEPVAFVVRDARVEDDLWSSSADFVTVRPPEAGAMALSLSGANGGAAPSGARLQVTVVRIR